MKLQKNAEKKDTPSEVINARFVKPLDENLLCKQIENAQHIFTHWKKIPSPEVSEVPFLELAEKEFHFKKVIYQIGIPDQFISHGNIAILRKKNYSLMFRELYLEIENKLIYKG